MIFVGRFDLKRLLITFKLLENYKEQITQSADNVSQMEGFRGNDEFRDASLDYLEFHENLASNEFDRLIGDLIQELDGTYKMTEEEWAEISEKNYLTTE